ncbi:MAG TPA: ribose 5-phosphate isomerase A [Solirubrobacteraceae bacterium]|nr:ribose 5-phosphate isomerase A [Solirubrobacteraceae bacterium]
MAPDRAIARQQPPLSGSSLVEQYKRAAAEAAAAIVRDGMRVGLGTGSTVAYLLPALAERNLSGLRCVATSPATEAATLALGFRVEELDAVGELDIAIDGADQVDPRGWLVKGGGGALTREKIVAAASRLFVVIVSAEKAVAALSPPVPLEVLRFGARRTLAEVGDTRLRRDPAGPDDDLKGPDDDLESPDDDLRSPDGNLIADYLGPVEDAASLAARLSATPGVVEHGLFEPELVSYILIAGGAPRRDGGVGVERREGGKSG